MSSFFCLRVCCEQRCTCFARDHRIQKRHIVRYVTVTWQWSPRHDQALEESLSTHLCSLSYLVPPQLLASIKEHAYHPLQSVSFPMPMIVNEKAHTKPVELLNKTLCSTWYTAKYQQQDHDQLPLRLALHSDGRYRSQMISVLCSDRAALPALTRQVWRNASDTSPAAGTITRAVQLIVDGYNMRVEIVSADHRDLCVFSPSESVHVIVIDRDDSANKVNVCCRRIWNSCGSVKGVLVLYRRGKCAKTRKQEKLIQRVAHYWNIPCISMTDKIRQNLLQFAVKYHWFCDTLE